MLYLTKPYQQTVDELAAGYAAGRALHILNYHSTPQRRLDEFRRQMEACAGRFSAFGAEDLDAWFDGTRTADKPPLIPVLFEGFRDNYDVILPVIEEFGFKAWFFLPSHFPNVALAEQRAFAEAHTLHYHVDDYPGARIVMTWDELRDARARGHVAACHSRTHAELTPQTPEAVLRSEIAGAKEELEAGLGAPVDIFCWLHGAETGLNPRADEIMRGAGYRYLFSNFRLQRLQ